MRQHTVRAYEEELNRLRTQLLDMSTAVERMIVDSMRSLSQHDAALAEDVIQRDHEIDRMELDTDDLCIRILARRQPTGSDLRFLVMVLKVVIDLERIGDLCADIAKRAKEIADGLAATSPEALDVMTDNVRSMLCEAMAAFSGSDVTRARAVIERDVIVDTHNAEVFRMLLQDMTDHPAHTLWATRTQAVAKCLERIGDHTTNIAELAVYMISGKDIRHRAVQGPETDAGYPRGVLFLCVHNAARSQMAEGLARKLLPAQVKVWSAGSDPAAEVHPRAIAAMADIGIDISGQHPKRLTDIPLNQVDTIVTLCEEEVCVTLPGITRQETWALPDPAKTQGTSEDVAPAFARIRDELQARIKRALIPSS